MQEIYQNEIYELVDSKKFVETLLAFNEEISIMAQKIGVKKETINSWLDQESNPLSSNILKIMQVYNCTCEDLGAKAIKIEDSFGLRLKYLLDKKNLTQKQFAKMMTELGTNISETSVSKWCNNETLPPLNKIIDIANFFGVSYLYLLGLIKHERVSDLIVKELNGVNDETADNIVLLLNSTVYGTTAHKKIKEKYGFDYDDILEYFTQNKLLFDMFYFEVFKSLEYYSNKEYFRAFENFYNGYDVFWEDVYDSADSSYLSAPYKVKQQDFSRSILQNLIGNIFDEFIEKILKEKNIEKLSQTTLNEYDYKEWMKAIGKKNNSDKK